MGCCSGGSSENNSNGFFNEEGHSGVEELAKVNSIEDANQLIKEGHVLLAVYWNSMKMSEEYILGKTVSKKTSAKKVGFSI